MQVIARAPCKPALYLGHLVSSVIIHDQVDVKTFRDGGIDLLQKAQELLMTLPLVERGHYFAGGHIQGGKQRRGPVADIVMSLTFGYARSQGQDRPCPVECLNLAFLIY